MVAVAGQGRVTLITWQWQWHGWFPSGPGLEARGDEAVSEHWADDGDSGRWSLTRSLAEHHHHHHHDTCHLMMSAGSSFGGLHVHQVTVVSA